jgi:hypothetical protein
MIRLKFLVAVAVLSAVVATPALAERMIDEPGMYAFYHPNGDLGIGSSRPAEAMAAEPAPGSGNIARLRMQSHPVSARRAKVIKAY